MFARALIVALVFAGCLGNTQIPSCERGPPGIMSEELPNVEKGGFNIASPGVPDEWFFPEEFQAFGGDPNVTDPGPDNATLLELGNRGGELRRQRAQLGPGDDEERRRIDAEIAKTQAEYLRVEAEYHRLRMAILRDAGERFLSNLLYDLAADDPDLVLVRASASGASILAYAETEDAMEWLLDRPYIVNVYPNQMLSACAH